MICCFCRAHVDDVDDAVNAGWWPDFWHAGINYEGPVCQSCTTHLVFDANGDADLRPGTTLPALAISLTTRPNMK